MGFEEEGEGGGEDKVDVDDASDASDGVEEELEELPLRWDCLGIGRKRTMGKGDSSNSSELSSSVSLVTTSVSPSEPCEVFSIISRGALGEVEVEVEVGVVLWGRDKGRLLLR